MRHKNRLNTVGALAGLCLFSTCLWADTTLLNASYDATRELYQAYNPAFAAHWLKTTGRTIYVAQSHGGSGSQALAVINGLNADVVTLGVPSDVDAIADQAQLLPRAWRKRLPDDSSPYTSTIVFLVRRGNPRHIHGWDDLIKPGVGVIPANPKISGAARLTYLAAWGQA
ncbi:MAG: sulfate ABC transporter substrate-binding protein, partial [bacterium]